ncbi:protein YgfX [Snodgrassella gandavensis]|uniref:protein YgfX n=1 Tax=Snodgrassella gandavensis TaxID=2946698 RepID=UPI001EF453B2|nr:protein YgfX [Snodgrassella gandavensis]
MLACVVRLRPSFGAQCLAVGMHGLALGVIVLYSIGWQRLLWLLAWLFSALWAGYGLRQNKVKRIEISQQGQASLVLMHRKTAIPAILCSGSMVRAKLMALQWQTARGSVYQLLLPDMMDALAWRRLQVWVRWCQPHKAQPVLRQSILNKVIHWFRLKDNN